MGGACPKCPKCLRLSEGHRIQLEIGPRDSMQLDPGRFWRRGFSLFGRENPLWGSVFLCPPKILSQKKPAKNCEKGRDAKGCRLKFEPIKSIIEQKIADVGSKKLPQNIFFLPSKTHGVFLKPFFPRVFKSYSCYSTKKVDHRWFHRCRWIEGSGRHILGCPRKLGSMVSKWVITYL